LASSGPSSRSPSSSSSSISSISSSWPSEASSSEPNYYMFRISIMTSWAPETI
jgi:hypothetical protein